MYQNTLTEGQENAYRIKFRTY